MARVIAQAPIKAGALFPRGIDQTVQVPANREAAFRTWAKAQAVGDLSVDVSNVDGSYVGTDIPGRGGSSTMRVTIMSHTSPFRDRDGFEGYKDVQRALKTIDGF